MSSTGNPPEADSSETASDRRPFLSPDKALLVSFLWANKENEQYKNKICSKKVEHILYMFNH
jgi:hypothetical protein